MWVSLLEAKADACDETSRELVDFGNVDVQAKMWVVLGTRRASDDLTGFASRWVIVRAQECEAAKREERTDHASPCTASVRDHLADAPSLRDAGRGRPAPAGRSVAKCEVGRGRLLGSDLDRVLRRNSPAPRNCATIDGMAAQGPTAAQLGRHLQELREAAGMTIPELAQRAQMPVDRVVMLESGVVDPHCDELMEYALGLGIRLSVVFRLWERALN